MSEQRRRSPKRAARSAKARERARGPRAARLSVGWREVALLVACAELAVLVLVFDPSMRNVFDLPKATFSHALAWALFGVVVVIGLLDGVRVPVSPLFVGFYLVLAGELLTTATAENRYVALFGEIGRYLGLTTHAVLALLAVAIAIALDYPRRAPWLGWTMAGLAVVAGVYALAQAAGADPVGWVDLDSRARPFAMLGNPDFYGQFLSAVVVGCAALVVFSRQLGLLRWAVAALGCASAALMVVVATRGSVLGVAAGAVAVAILWLRRTGLSHRALGRLGLAAAAFAVALGIVVVATPLGARLFQIADSPEVRGRLLIYDAAARIFADHPVTGVGFENFAVAYPRYEEAEGLKNNRTQTSAHSWLFHTAATTGTIGLVTTIALLVAFAVHAWQRARDDDAPALLVVASALAAYLGSGLVLPGAQAIQWIPWACTGVALASDLRTASVALRLPGRALPTGAQLAVVIGLAVVGALQLGPLEANRAAKTAENTLRAETAERSVQAARRATAIDPGRAVYWNTLGRALELVDDQAGARAAYVEATDRSPYTPAFWWNLGRMNLHFAQAGEAGARDAAYEALRRGIAAAPRNPDTFDQLARIQLALGDLAAALENERHAISLYPGEPRYYTVAADALWRQGDGPATVEVLRQGVAATDANDLRLTLARRLIDLRQTAEARAVLREVVARDPADATALALLRQLESQ